MAMKVAAAAAFAAALTFALPAEAQATRFLTINGYSYHFNRAKDYNERNFGAGIEHKVWKDFSIFAGFYVNSRPGGEETSAYGTIAWLPLAWGPLRAGGMFGAVTGYKAAPVLPAASAIVSLTGQTYGLNVHWIPPAQWKHVGTLGFQFKQAF